MDDPYRFADLSKLKTEPLAGRAHKVSAKDFGAPVDPTGSLDAALCWRPPDPRPLVHPGESTPP